MKTLIYILISTVIISFAAGCKTKTLYVPVESTKIVKDIQTVRDTIIDIRLVPYFEQATTDRDSSYLRNEYAYSSAWWDGKLLHHNLGIFDKPISFKILYVDRWHFVSDSTQVPYPVVEYKEVNRLTGWQNFQVWCGRIGLIVLLIIGLMLYLKRKI